MLGYTPPSPQKPAVSELISESFPPFDHRTAVVEPFDIEHKRDAEFQEKSSRMLLDVMLVFHAWSIARPTQESEHTANALEKEINLVIATEAEQGMSPSYASLVEKTRQRLNEFVQKIKTALAALTGLME